MVTQVHDQAKTQDWLDRSKGGEGWETSVVGYRGVQGTQPDTKIIRLMDDNSLKKTPLDLFAPEKMFSVKQHCFQLQLLVLE